MHAARKRKETKRGGEQSPGPPRRAPSATHPATRPHRGLGGLGSTPGAGRGAGETPNPTTTAAALSLSPTRPRPLLFPPSLPPAPRRLPCPGPVPPPTCDGEQHQPHQQHQRRRFHSAARAAPPPASPRLPAAAPPRAHRPAGEAPVTSGRHRPGPAGYRRARSPGRPRGVSACSAPVGVAANFPRGRTCPQQSGVVRCGCRVTILALGRLCPRATRPSRALLRLAIMICTRLC